MKSHRHGEPPSDRAWPQQCSGAESSGAESSGIESSGVAAAASGAEHTSDAIALVFSRAAIRVCIAWTIGFVVLTAAWFTIGQTVMDQTVMDQTVMEQTTIESPTVKTTISSFPANFTDQWSKMILISIASGLVSFAALLPGWVIGKSVANDKSVLTGTATIGVSAALAIRFTGTVALFVACRYHFGVHGLASVAFLVIAWYVLLTMVEVQQLAKGLTALDQPPNA
jgi:hypothetical protein